MANKKFLDYDGALYLWGKIVAKITAMMPTKTSQLTNDSGFLTKHQDISGKVDKVSGKALSTNDYTTADKNKLAGIAAGANKTVVDSELSGTSTNPVQNKVINTALSGKANSADLKTVATTGSYTDLINKPTIPTVPSNVSAFTNDAGYLKSHQDISGKADKATTLAGYGITNAYTKTEVNNLVGSVMKYMGTVDSASALPAKPTKGDVYNVKAAGGSDASGVLIKAGDNVAWNGSGWDVLAGTVDLSGYVQATDSISNGEIDTIVAS